MANDYLHMRCTFCGKTFRLLGWMPSCNLSVEQTTLGPLNEFLDTHLACREDTEGYPGDFGRNPGFAIITDQQRADLVAKDRAK